MRGAPTLVVLMIIGGAILAVDTANAQDGPPPPDALSELRRSFTIGGSPVPPLVFRDLGDGDAADLKPSLITVDVWAAIGSNRYGDAVRSDQGWVAQTGRAADGDKGTETEAYHFLGATPDGLMALVTENTTSEGSYEPATLHVVDAAATKAFDVDGKVYGRVSVTVLAEYPLGDGWRGRATLDGDTVTVLTEAGATHSTQATDNIHRYRIVRP